MTLTRRLETVETELARMKAELENADALLDRHEALDMRVGVPGHAVSWVSVATSSTAKAMLRNKRTVLFHEVAKLEAKLEKIEEIL